MPPSHVFLQREGNRVRLSWNAVTRAVRYNIYVSRDGGNSFKLVTPKGLDKNEVIMGGMKAGGSYTFGVSALSADGRESQKAVQTLSAQ